MDVMCEKYGFPREAVEMIPLAADTERFRLDGGVRKAQRRALGVFDKEVVILYAGKMVADKGPHNILRAVKRSRWPRCPRSRN